MRKATKIAVALLFAVVLSGCARLPSEAVCQINIDTWSGSGTLVAVNGDRALVLTCRHVCRKDGQRALVTWHATGEKCEGEVLDVVTATNGFESDLAFLVCTKPAGITPVEIRKFSPGNGPFTCMGYRRNEFYVSTSRHGAEYGGLIRLSAPLVGGMSGGPCFDSSGYLVGVGVGSAPSYSVAANGQYLVDLVNKYKW